MSEWLAVANPYAGGHEGKRAQFIRTFQSLQAPDNDLRFSEYPGHAQELAAAATDYSGVIAIGGDGTLFEVLNGVDRRDREVAIVPSGRGNSLAQDLGLNTVSHAIEALRYGITRSIDVAEITLLGGPSHRTRLLSASTVAVGYPASATMLAGRMKYLGRLSYAAAATIVSCKLKSDCFEVGYDGGPRKPRRLTGPIISNTRHLANFIAFPEADCSDGALDVMELTAGVIHQNLRNFSALSRIDLCATAASSTVSTASCLLDAGGG